jgi:hypothetical protein
MSVAAEIKIRPPAVDDWQVRQIVRLLVPTVDSAAVDRVSMRRQARKKLRLGCLVRRQARKKFRLGCLVRRQTAGKDGPILPDAAPSVLDQSRIHADRICDETTCRTREKSLCPGAFIPEVLFCLVFNKIDLP